ncbi:hypothetical protein F3N42_10660 [Marinihelvus fidelis]|uniref:CN hydrolase domain-containing protein n=1 Tax=Marinihelvus fidelis TaxID=2613842 RepID=A0A5N0T761_9GAMM|nr:nitrilase-related carbon-nitrogen hydrolase [Marinihelvus fidelis]KAA9130823.1 hypothetical protein F3N42_10660 [Marinihelvus fidelis]
MSEDLTLTLVQPRLEWRDPGTNREYLQKLILSAEPSGLYLLPETFTTGFQGGEPVQGETMSGDTVAWMRELASSTGGVIGGSVVIEDDDGQRRNRFLLVHPDERVDVYDKRHLFSYSGEDRRYVAGRERVVFTIGEWRVCPMVCYDLRFPAWCRVRDDYDLLLFVANWPDSRIGAWDALLRARAIENQCVVAAVNRVGQDNRGLRYNGHSAIYDAMGDAVIEPWEDEGVKTATVSLEDVRRVRRELPFLAEADAFSFDPNPP